MIASFLMNYIFNIVGTVKEDLSPQGLGDSSNLPSRTNEVIRLEKGLLAGCLQGRGHILAVFSD